MIRSMDVRSLITTSIYNRPIHKTTEPVTPRNNRIGELCSSKLNKITWTKEGRSRGELQVPQCIAARDASSNKHGRVLKSLMVFYSDFIFSTITSRKPIDSNQTVAFKILISKYASETNTAAVNEK